jgi:hypothetical protein
MAGGSSKGTKKTVSEQKGYKNLPGAETVLTRSTLGSDPSPRDQKEFPPDYYRDGRRVEVPPKEPGGESTFQWGPIPRAIETLGANNDNYKKDSLCTIRVIQGVGTTNSPHKNLVPPFLKFFLTGVDAPRSERYQVVETFGDWYIFFYGERPPIYTFSGVLLNTPNYNWLNEFDFFYDSFLRGTAATRNVTRIFITYGFQQVQGHLLDFTHSIRAETDMAVQFQIRMAVVKRFALSPDYGNRVTDSFITNYETIAAFQKAIGDDPGRKYNYSMLKSIMAAEAKPANVNTAAKSKEVKELTEKIAKIGFKDPYDSAKGEVV